jgi:hypothetical protein
MIQGNERLAVLEVPGADESREPVSADAGRDYTEMRCGVGQSIEHFLC